MVLIYATTLTRVKSLLDIPTTATAANVTLTGMIAAVSAEIENFIGKPLSREARTEDYTIALHGRAIWLRATPVLTVASINVDPFWQWTGDAIETDRYKLTATTGQVYFLDQLIGGISDLAPEAVDAVRVVYTGGIATSTAELLTAAPDIALAADLQVAEDWRRRDNPATSRHGGPGGGSSWIDNHRFLPRVQELLLSHRRMVFDI